MSKLLTLIKEVQEKNLTKTQLEEYHASMTSVYAQMLWDMAELEKKEAIYFLEHKTFINLKGESEERSDVAIKRMWRGTEEGQRLIELKNYEKATSKVLGSLKNRIFAAMY